MEEYKLFDAEYRLMELVWNLEPVNSTALARRCDGFSIGGTKQGLLFGEALVLSHPALRRDFRYHIKQHGGLLGGPNDV